MSDSFSLALAPPWDDVGVGTFVNVRARLVLYDPCGAKHLFRCMITQRFFIVTGMISNMPIFSFLHCRLIASAPRLHLSIAEGYALGQAVPTNQVMETAVETCAGIGLLGEG